MLEQTVTVNGNTWNRKAVHLAVCDTSIDTGPAELGLLDAAENMFGARHDFDGLINELNRIALYATEEAERLRVIAGNETPTDEVAAVISRRTTDTISRLKDRLDDADRYAKLIDGEFHRYKGALNAYNTSLELAAKREHTATIAALQPTDGDTRKRPPTYKEMPGTRVYSADYGPGTVTEVDGQRSFTVTFDHDIPKGARGFRNRPYNAERPNDIEFYNRDRVTWLKPTATAQRA